jgi:ectoine hydroxylase-related dioxygenase (phytanoyl-CoA dioxygenase family)
VLKEIPSLAPLLFNQKLKQLIADKFGKGYFVSKSIYFDKPGNSNWFVAYHQDLTISVMEKAMVEGFGPYTSKQDQFAVQPPVAILDKNFTIRIHLDQTDERNGALRVIPASHLAGIRRIEQVDNKNDEVLCCVEEGGIMLMHPLLFHASGKSTGNLPRRVLHIEFSNQVLPEGLNWSEQFEFQ